MRPEDRERYTREVLKCLDELEAIDSERKAAMSDFNARREDVAHRLKGWRALLAGRKGEQLPLPEGEP